jgi:hypothetical protein
VVGVYATRGKELLRAHSVLVGYGMPCYPVGAGVADPVQALTGPPGPFVTGLTHGSARHSQSHIPGQCRGIASLNRVRARGMGSGDRNDTEPNANGGPRPSVGTVLTHRRNASRSSSRSLRRVA